MDMSTERTAPDTRGLRGEVVYFTGDPFLVGDEALTHHEDGLVVVRNGMITAVGPYREVRDALPAGAPVDHHRDHLISAGFVDAHVHYSQTGAIASYGGRLMEWLDEYVYPEEQRLGDPAEARRAARFFVGELLRNGTTTALAFAATYPGSVDALLEETHRRGMRMIAGKVMMDRDAPPGLLDTAQRAYDDSRALLDRWQGRGRTGYAITPRFAPSCTPAELEAAGALWKEHPDVHVHTHLSESADEVAQVRELFPERDGYLDVYDHHGLVGRRAVFAHGVHVTPAERDRLHAAGAALAHCPTSNLFLGSGLFDLKEAKDRRRPIPVGLGTDVGAGTSFSLLATMNEAYKVAALRSFPLPATGLFHLATLGGAEALDLADRIGTLTPGHEADVVVLDPRATPLLEFRTARAESLEEKLFVLATLGDDRAVKATYIAGRPQYERPAP